MWAWCTQCQNNSINKSICRTRALWNCSDYLDKYTTTLRSVSFSSLPSHTCTHARMHARTHSHTHTRAHTHVHTHTHYMYACTHKHMNTHTHTKVSQTVICSVFRGEECDCCRAGFTVCSFQLQVFSDNDGCCVQVWITGYRCLVLVTVVCRSGRQVFSVSDCCVQVWKTGVLCLMLVTVVCRSGRRVFWW